MISVSQFVQAIRNESYNVVEQFITEQRQLAVEEALRVLPQVVNSLVLNTARIKDLKDKFFSDPSNNDLLDRKEFFVRVMEEIEASNPGISYDTLIAQSAIEARKRIKTLNLGSHRPTQKPSLETIDDHLRGMFEEST